MICSRSSSRGARDKVRVSSGIDVHNGGCATQYHAKRSSASSSAITEEAELRSA